MEVRHGQGERREKALRSISGQAGPFEDEEAGIQASEASKHAPKPVSALQVGGAAEAQVLFLGTFFEERVPQWTANSIAGSLPQEPVRVVAASLQVLDVEMGTPLLVVTAEWPRGAGIGEAARALTEPFLKVREP